MWPGPGMFVASSVPWRLDSPVLTALPFTEGVSPNDSNARMPWAVRRRDADGKAPRPHALSTATPAPFRGVGVRSEPPRGGRK